MLKVFTAMFLLIMLLSPITLRPLLHLHDVWPQAMTGVVTWVVQPVLVVCTDQCCDVNHGL